MYKNTTLFLKSNSNRTSIKFKFVFYNSCFTFNRTYSYYGLPTVIIGKYKLYMEIWHVEIASNRFISD